MLFSILCPSQKNVINTSYDNQLHMQIQDFNNHPCLVDFDKDKIKHALESGQWITDMTKEIYVFTKQYCNVLIPHPFKDNVVVHKNSKLEFKATSIETLNDILTYIINICDEYLHTYPGTIGEIYVSQYHKMRSRLVSDDDSKVLAESRAEIRAALISERITIRNNYKEITSKEMRC